MPRLGTGQLGSSQLGTIGTIRTINLDSTSSSTLTHDINAILSLTTSPASTSTLSHGINGTFTLDLQPKPGRVGSKRLGGSQLGATSDGFASGSNLSHGINGTFTLSKTSSSDSILSKDISRIFTISLTPTNSRIGDSQLGRGKVGQPSSFESTTSLSLNQQAVRQIEVDSTTASEFEFILSEDVYAEQYGRSRGQAEIDTIVEGNAELDIIVVGNAEVD